MYKNVPNGGNTHMRFEDLNWFDIESYLQQDDRLMIVLGSCEQHAYLSLLTDVKIPLALADTASERCGVLVAPTVNFGVSPYFAAYPGTISLRTNTLLFLVQDLVESVYRHGFKRILFLNGHGGNIPARSILYELANQFENLQTAWYSWWQSHSVIQVAQKYDLKPAHANWIEAFPFTNKGTPPSIGKPPPFVSGLLSADKAKQTYGDGSFGGYYSVEPSIMEEVFEAAILDILQLLHFDTENINPNTTINPNVDLKG